MNNAMLSFQKPAKEKTGKMRELAPSLPVLVATRDIGIGEEVRCVTMGSRTHKPLTLL